MNNTHVLHAAAVAWLAPAVILWGANSGAAQAGAEADRQAAAKKVLDEAASRPTPKAVDGRPDLSGTWAAPSGAPRRETNVNPSDSKKGPAGTPGNPVLKLSQQQEQAGNISNVARRKANSAARPDYKPEFRNKWEYLFDNAAKQDPSYKCMPMGVPAHGTTAGDCPDTQSRLPAVCGPCFNAEPLSNRTNRRQIPRQRRRPDA